MTKNILSGVAGALIVAFLIFLISKLANEIVVDWLGGATKSDLRNLRSELIVRLDESKLQITQYPDIESQPGPQDLGQHKFCALTKINEIHYERGNPNHGSDSHCYLEEDNGVWSIYARNASCTATCIDQAIDQ
ncbi:MAG: hypothetical protein MJA83_16835 [Gammaproteobacteria bacterium]|nr:hypothetical protein [Gammaproteobacteria bacterium]